MPTGKVGESGMPAPRGAPRNAGGTEKGVSMTTALAVKGFNEISYDELMDVNGGDIDVTVTWTSGTKTTTIHAWLNDNGGGISWSTTDSSGYDTSFNGSN